MAGEHGGTMCHPLDFCANSGVVGHGAAARPEPGPGSNVCGGISAISAPMVGHGTEAWARHNAQQQQGWCRHEQWHGVVPSALVAAQSYEHCQHLRVTYN